MVSERFSIIAKALYGIAAVALLAGIGTFAVGLITELFGEDQYFMVLGLNLVVLVSLPSYFLAKRFAHPTAEEALKHDPRGPILYLRSFADERPAGALFSNLKTLESTISDYFTHEKFMGHLVAIGDPSGTSASLGEGASLAFVPNSAWQQSILSWMKAARMIVMVPFATEGVRWELQQVLGHGHLNKLLILLPLASKSGTSPGYETTKEKESRWLALLKNLAATPFAASLRDVNFDHALAIYFPPNGSTVVLCGEPRAHVAEKLDRLYDQVLDVSLYGMFAADWSSRAA